MGDFIFRRAIVKGMALTELGLRGQIAQTREEMS